MDKFTLGFSVGIVAYLVVSIGILGLPEKDREEGRCQSVCWAANSEPIECSPVEVVCRNADEVLVAPVPSEPKEVE